MRSLFNRATPGALLAELPPLLVAVTIAELFFKFGSFTLEAVACGAVWVVAREGTVALRRLMQGGERQ